MERQGYGDRYEGESMPPPDQKDNIGDHLDNALFFEGQDQPTDMPESNRVSQPEDPSGAAKPNDGSVDTGEESGKDVKFAAAISQAAEAVGITTAGVEERVMAAFEHYWNDSSATPFSEVLRTYLQNEQNDQGWEALSDRELDALATELESRQWQQEQEDHTRVISQLPDLDEISVTAARQALQRKRSQEDTRDT